MRKNVIINGTCATSSVKTCDVVKLAIQTTDPTIKICVKATVLEEICHPITQQPVRARLRNYPHLNGLRITDYHKDDIDLQIEW